MRDREEYEVQEVLDHQGDPKLRGKMTFLVKWKGYDNSHNTWEPWKSLRLVDKLHEYLRKQKMEKLIPRECLIQQTPEPSRNAKKRKRQHLRVTIDESMNEFIDVSSNKAATESRRSSRQKTTTPVDLS